MAFNGTLFSISGTVFPTKWIYKESYKVSPSQRLDLESGRSVTGLMIRNVLPHTASKITFQTKPMWNNDMAQCMAFITSRYVNVQEKKLNITYYRPDTDDYASGVFYVPDLDFEMDLIDEVQKRVLYRSMEISFIEY